MVIIYNCYGGTHSSILSSAVHMKFLPSDRVPCDEEILNLKYFNKLTYKDMGRLIFHGKDEYGNSVYTIGRGTSKALVPAMRSLLLSLYSECGIKESFLFINTSPTVPLPMTFGGFFSRGLGIDTIGVPLLLLGTKKAWPEILKLVDETKKICCETPESPLIIDIDAKGRLSRISPADL